MKKYFQFSFGIAISALFLWLAFRNADMGKIFIILRDINLVMIVAAFLIAVLGLLVRSYRWKLLGKDYRGIPWRYFFRATTIGLMLNVFLPFRGGDLFQSYFLSKKSKLPKSYTLATVFLERLVDIVPPALMLVIGSFFVVLPSQIRMSRLALIVGFVVSIIYIFVRFQDRISSLVDRFIRGSHSEKIKKLFENVKNAMVFLKDRQVITMAIPLTFGLWVLYTIATYLILHSLGIKINFAAVFLVQAIGVMSVAIPSSPGYIGTWEFFCLLALSIFGVDRDLALSYAILSHFMAFLPTIMIGLFYFFQEVFIDRKIVITEPSESLDPS